QAEDGMRDFHVTGVQTCALPIFVVAAAWMGKLKTVAQSVAITLALLPLADVLGPAAPVAYWVNVITMTVAVVLTIVSGIDYVVRSEERRVGQEGRARWPRGVGQQ